MIKRGAGAGSLHLAHGLAPDPPQQLRECSGDHERATVEQLLDEASGAAKLKPGDPSDQEVDRDERAPGVEATGNDRRRTEEGGRKGRQ